MHQTLRSSNKFWNAIYYDNLLDTNHYQISFLKDADRLYFNCVHALNTDEDSIIEQIEAYFFECDLNPAIYIDPQSPLDLKKRILDRGYTECQSEAENWYEYYCTHHTLERSTTQSREYQTRNPQLECVLFDPKMSESLLDHFLMVDGKANEISKTVLMKLKRNLMHPKDPSIKLTCALAFLNKEPVSTSLLGVYQNTTFLAEGATNQEFRQRGIYTWLTQVSMLSAIQQGCSRIVVNCDNGSYSNNTFKTLGFSNLGQRQFFIKSS